MNLPKSVAELQDENVVFELECIDRMYLNLYVPQLASAPGVAAYFRGYKGHRFASTKEAVAMSERFRRQVLDFAERKATPIIRFEKGMRKDDVMHKRLRKFKAREGVVFIGIAQEKARVPRTIRKRFGEGEGTIPWIDYTTAMVKHYYFYCVDEDFGAFFIKFCSTFPTRASSASTGTSISRGSWPGAASNSKRSTTGSCAVGTRRRRSASRRLSMKRRSRDFSASGSQYCRTPIQRQTERPAFATGSRCCRRSFPSLRFGITRGTGGNFSRKSSGRTSIWADPKRCS